MQTPLLSRTTSQRKFISSNWTLSTGWLYSSHVAGCRLACLFLFTCSAEYIPRPLFLPVCPLLCGCYSVKEAGGCQQRSEAEQENGLDVREKRGTSVALNTCRKDGQEAIYTSKCYVHTYVGNRNRRCCIL